MRNFIKMLSVKIEFCLLDWIQAVQHQLFYTKKCTVYVQSVSKQSPKAQKKKMQFT